MKPARWPSYDVADYEIVAETPELRMVMITLAAGQERAAKARLQPR